jgi:hypothetical protein
MELETLYTKIGRGRRSARQEPHITLSAKTHNIQFNKSAVLIMASPGKTVAFLKRSSPLESLCEWVLNFDHPQGWKVNQSGIVSAPEAAAAIRESIAVDTGQDLAGKRISIPICRNPRSKDQPNSYSLLISKIIINE